MPVVLQVHRLKLWFQEGGCPLYAEFGIDGITDDVASKAGHAPSIGQLARGYFIVAC